MSNVLDNLGRIKVTFNSVLNAARVTALRKLDDSADAFYVADSTGSVIGINHIVATGQLGSAVATGTAPLAVASTTLNTNLNADMVDGYHAVEFAPALSVKNTSGATAAAGDVGYLVYTAASGIEYKTTTTAIDTKAETACVVTVGAANNSTIKVATRGRYTVPYAGTAPNAGDFLVFSATATKIQQQTTMRPEVMGVAMAAGSGGTVDALLLTGTVFVPYTSANDFYRCNSHSQSIFTATINGAPSATSVVYTVVTGQEDVLPPAASTELAKLMLYNSTRSTYRLITACNTGTNTITTVSSADAWANGDTLTIANADIADSLAPAARLVGFDLSQQTEIPVLTRAVLLNHLSSDTGGAGQTSQFHPYVAYSASKLINSTGTNSTSQIYNNTTIALYNQRLGKRETASGTATKLTILKIVGYYLAMP